MLGWMWGDDLPSEVVGQLELVQAVVVVELVVQVEQVVVDEVQEIVVVLEV